MKTQPDPKILTRLANYVTFASLASMVIGVSVLFGWAFDFQVLKAWFPGLETMKPLTAISFLLAGGALLLLRKDDPNIGLRWVGRFCAGGVTLIGGLVTLEYVLNSNLGIDQWLFREAVLAEGVIYPGRPSPTAVICFVLMGAALFTIRRKTSRIIPFLAIPVLLISLLALVGYAYGVSSFYKIGPYSSMAFHTALLFFITSLALLGVQPENLLVRVPITPLAGGVTARRLLPAAILIPLMLGWLHLQGERLGWYDTRFGLALFATSNIIVFTGLIYWNASLLNRADAERESASAALSRASRTRLQISIDTMQEGCQIIGFDWRYLYLNDAAVAQGRYSREELLGHTMVEKYPGIEKTALFTTLRRCMEERTPHRMENQIIFPDGSRGWFDMSIQPVEEGVFILSRDITRHKRGEITLLESERHLRKIFDNFAGFMVLLTLDGFILDVNRLPLSLAGLIREEVLENHLAETHWMNHSPATQRQIRTILSRVGQGEIVSEEIRVRMGDETIIDVFAIFTPLRDSSGVIVQILGSGFDITDRKRAEAALEQARIELEERVEELTRKR